MDWNDVRFFMEIFRRGSLSAAARELRVDQATVGRRLDALERQLGSRLFLRTAQGLSPTPLAQDLWPEACRLEEAALALESRAAGRDEEMAGLVRVATTDTLAQVFVVPALARLQRRCPNIELALQTGADLVNLARREADVAIRTVKPQHPDLIVRRLMDLTVRPYASASYLEHHPPPRRGEHFAGQQVLLSLRPTGWSESGRLAGEPMTHARVAARFNSLATMVAAAEAGMGIAELPDFVATRSAGLQPLWPSPEKRYTVWMVVQPDLYRTARVRAVMDAVAATVAGMEPAAQ